jgi:hypothetical protein
MSTDASQPWWDGDWGYANLESQNNGGTNDPFLRIDYTINAVSIPGAIWLFGAGLLGLMGVRKRFPG